MRKVWSPYDQSCILGEAASKKVGRGEHDPLAQLFYWRVIGHRGSTVSSWRGHGLPAHHHFRQRYPNYMTGNRGITHTSFHGQPTPKVTKLWRYTSQELLSHLGHCWATPAGAAPRGVIAPVLRNAIFVFFICGCIYVKYFLGKGKICCNML